MPREARRESRRAGRKLRLTSRNSRRNARKRPGALNQSPNSQRTNSPVCLSISEAAVVAVSLFAAKDNFSCDIMKTSWGMCKQGKCHRDCDFLFSSCRMGKPSGAVCCRLLALTSDLTLWGQRTRTCSSSIFFDAFEYVETRNKLLKFPRPRFLFFNTLDNFMCECFHVVSEGKGDHNLFVLFLFCLLGLSFQSLFLCRKSI